MGERVQFSKKLPDGMRDFVPCECKKKATLKKKINNLFDLWGYEEIVTPVLEYYDTFRQCPESFEEDEMYKLSDINGRILVMRPDMTIPIARLIANKYKDENKLRFRYCSDIYRSNKFYGGKKNEYTDCGIELINNNRYNSDVEILYLAFKSLELLNVNNYKLEISSTKIINLLFKNIGIPSYEVKQLEMLIDKKSIPDLIEYTSKMDISQKNKSLINELPWLCGDIKILDRLPLENVCSEINDEIEYLKKVCNAMSKFGYSDKIIIDLARIPKPDYYSGIIFTAYVDSIGEKVLSGGRYDKLFTSFGIKKEAVGFSINLDSVAPIITTQTDKPVLVGDGLSIEDAINEAESLTKDGKRVQII